jgi:hypothetical protein
MAEEYRDYLAARVLTENKPVSPNFSLKISPCLTLAGHLPPSVARSAGRRQFGEAVSTHVFLAHMSKPADAS